jgi:hypothetical protein
MLQGVMEATVLALQLLTATRACSLDWCNILVVTTFSSRMADMASLSHAGWCFVHCE